MRRRPIILLLTLLAVIVPGADAANPASGKFWYEQNCARCHGSPPQERQAGTPNITGASAALIRDALNRVVAMAKVALREDQVLDVEAYLRRPAEQVSAPGIDFSDLWWNPAEPGWGLSLTQRPSSRMVGFLYLYDAGGAPLWLLCSDLQWRDPLTVAGTLLRTRAAGFPAPGFDPASVALQTAGSIVLRFQDDRRGIIEFSIDGVAYRRPIERFGF